MKKKRELHRQIQIGLFWGDTPIDVFQMEEKPGSIFAGIDRQCEVPLPAHFFSQPKFPLIEITEDEVQVRGNSTCQWHVQDKAGTWSLAKVQDDSLNPGLCMIGLFQTRVRLTNGSLSLVISRVQVKSPRRTPISEYIEPRFANCLLVMFFLVAAFIASLLLEPRAVGSEEYIRKNVEPFVVHFSPSAQSARKFDFSNDLMKQILSQGLEANKPGGDKSGKAGQKNAPAVNRRSAVLGNGTSNPLGLQPRGILAAVQNSSIRQGVLAGESNGLGKDMENALGNVTGKNPGPSGGNGGWDTFGNGPGNNGNPELIRLPDEIASMPRTKEPRKNIDFKPAPEGKITIKGGEIKVSIALSMDQVRKVIQTHRDQMRFCYEQELSLHPQLAGTVSLHFVIDPKGHVVSVQARTVGAISQTGLAKCIESRVMAWQFPSPKNGSEVEVNYPFHFSQGGK